MDPVRLVRDMQPRSLLHILNDELVTAMDAAAETRLGIPLLVGEDGIHGHSFHPGATIFPTQLALACSWDLESIEACARVTAREMATTGAHWTFSPVLCLSRDLRWGRTGETFGEDLNPSGKLTISFPRHVGQQPVFYNQVRGQHGNTYADLSQAPRYPFGFGLSYTRFEYSSLRLSKTKLALGEALELNVTIRNVGARAGTEIAQVYISDLVTSVTWVDKSLVDFQRVKLEPGEERNLEFSIPQERLSLVNAYEQRLVEPGQFQVLVGPSSVSRDLLSAGFVVAGEAFSFAGIPGVARS